MDNLRFAIGVCLSSVVVKSRLPVAVIQRQLPHSYMHSTPLATGPLWTGTGGHFAPESGATMLRKTDLFILFEIGAPRVCGPEDCQAPATSRYLSFAILAY